MHSKRAFTLIELLVVISIIALLISILLPALGNARESARRAECLTRVKALIFVNYTYAQDYKSTWVNFDSSGLSWQRHFANGGYLPDIKVGMPGANGYWDHPWNTCPSTPTNANGLNNNGIPDMLAYSQFFGWSHGTHSGIVQWKWVRVDQVTIPGKTIMFADANAVGTGTERNYYFRHFGFLQQDKHNGAANYGFADGHAQAIDSSTAYALNNNQSSGTYPFMKPFDD